MLHYIKATKQLTDNRIKSRGITVFVSAFGKDEAVALAQADQINAGNRWREIAEIKEVTP